ncbi:hypothetical protein CHLRE_11g467741v5 [Chlamydomonas reinhardtii]|uniref:Uncharacterized protein n=1 Tax=Chlamydomonas reinhardtii TaxID=3055 RepID=A0A2K3D7W0_CHLRE|nr:uncharacterized protein CHLRE_11g467741v5 [Chlamydomonas reinhardtii]PNW76620.1 hypothetical protein CHLRE_11g467741v5 [Chlamydomonas reinhardtii]
MDRTPVTPSAGVFLLAEPDVAFGSTSNQRDVSSRRKPSPALSDQERRQAETVAQQLTAKKAVRQQAMRDQDRERAMLKGIVFRSGVEQALQQQRLLVDAEQRQAAAEELARLAGVFERRLGKMGEAHLEAATFMQQQREARAAQEQRQAELDEVQAQRFQSAIASIKSQHNVARLQAQQQQQRRAQILKAERDKAQAFSAEQAERSQAHKRRQEEQLRQEQERRRRAANGLSVDFRHTRLHEGLGAPGPISVPGVPAPPIPAVPDPVLSAEELAHKVELDRRRKEMAAAEAEHRARERFLAAQAKLRADAQRKQVEEELAELTAQRAAAKKQALEAHRLRLQDQRKQQELLRVFEDNFLQPEDDLAPRSLPSYLRPAAQRAPAGGAAPVPTARQVSVPLAAPGPAPVLAAAPVPNAAMPRWSKGRTAPLGRHPSPPPLPVVPAPPAKGEIAVQTDPEPPSISDQAATSLELPQSQLAPEPESQMVSSQDAATAEQQAAKEAGTVPAPSEAASADAQAAAAAPVDEADTAAMVDDDAMDEWAEEEVDRELARMRKELGLEDSDLRSSATSLTSGVSVPALLGDAAERRATSQLLREAADTAAAAALSLAGTGSTGAAAAAAAAARARAAAEVAARAAATATAETAAAAAAAAALATEDANLALDAPGTLTPAGKLGAGGAAAVPAAAASPADTLSSSVLRLLNTPSSISETPGAAAGAPSGAAAGSGRAAARAGAGNAGAAAGRAAGATSSRGLFAGLSPGSLPSDLDDVLLLSDLDWEELEGMAGLRPSGSATSGAGTPQQAPASARGSGLPAGAAAASGAARLPGAGAAAGAAASVSSSPSLSAVSDMSSIRRLVAEGILPPDIGALLASPGGLTSTLTAMTDLGRLPPPAGQSQEQLAISSGSHSRSALSSSVSGLSAILAAAPSAAASAGITADMASVLSLGSLSAASSLSSLSAYAAGLAAASAAAGRKGTGAVAQGGLAPIPEEVPGTASAPSASSSTISLPGAATAGGAGGAVAAAATSAPGLSQPVRLTLADLNRELMSSAAAWKGRLEAGSGAAAGAAAAAAAAAAASAAGSSASSLATRTALLGRSAAQPAGSGTPSRPARPGPMMFACLEPPPLGAPLQPHGLVHGAAPASTQSSPLSLPQASQRPAGGVAAASQGAAVGSLPQVLQTFAHPGTPSSSSLSYLGLAGTGLPAYGSGASAPAGTSTMLPAPPEAYTPGPAPSSSTSSLLTTPATTVTAGAARTGSGARGRHQLPGEQSSPYDMYDKESRRLAELMSSITASLQQSAQAVARAGGAGTTAGGGGAGAGGGGGRGGTTAGGGSLYASPSAAAAAALASANAARLLGELPTPSSVSSLSSATFSETLAAALEGRRRSPSAAVPGAAALGGAAATGGAIAAAGGDGGVGGSGSNRSTPTRTSARPGSGPTASPTRGLASLGMGVGRPSPSASPQQQGRRAVSARGSSGQAAGVPDAAPASPSATTLSSITSLLQATAALQGLSAQTGSAAAGAAAASGSAAAAPPFTSSASSLSSTVSSLQPRLNPSAGAGRSSDASRTVAVASTRSSPAKTAWAEQPAEAEEIAQSPALSPVGRGRQAPGISPSRASPSSRSARLAAGTAAARSPRSPAAGTAAGAEAEGPSPGPSLPSPGTPPSPAFTDSTLPSTVGASPTALHQPQPQHASTTAGLTAPRGAPSQAAQAGDAVATVAGAIADLLRRRAASTAAATEAAAAQQPPGATTELPPSPSATPAGRASTRASPPAGVWASLTGQTLEEALAGLMEGSESSLDDLLRSSLNLSASVSLADLMPPSQEPSAAAPPLPQPAPQQHEPAAPQPVQSAAIAGFPAPSAEPWTAGEPAPVVDGAIRTVAASSAGAAKLSPAGAGADTATEGAERPELSLSASAGSDDFGGIMAGLLQDIQRGLAAMGAAVAQPLPSATAARAAATAEQAEANAQTESEEAALRQAQQVQSGEGSQEDGPEELGLQERPWRPDAAGTEISRAASGPYGDGGLRTESEDELDQFQDDAVPRALAAQPALQLSSATAGGQPEDSAGTTGGSSSGWAGQPEFVSLPTFSRGFADGFLRRSSSLPSPPSPQSPRDGGNPDTWHGGATLPPSAAAASSGPQSGGSLASGASRLLSTASAPPPATIAAPTTTTSGAYSFLQAPRASAARGRTPSSVKSGGDSPSPPGSPLPPFCSADLGSLGADASMGAGVGLGATVEGGAAGAVTRPGTLGAAVGGGAGGTGSQQSSPTHSMTTVSSITSLTDAMAAYPLFGGMHHSPLGSPSSSDEDAEGARGAAGDHSTEVGRRGTLRASSGAAGMAAISGGNSRGGSGSGSGGVAASGGVPASLADWSPLPIQYESLQPAETAAADAASPRDTEPWHGAWDPPGLGLGGRRGPQDASGPWLWQGAGRAAGAGVAGEGHGDDGAGAGAVGWPQQESGQAPAQEDAQQSAQTHTPLAQRRPSSGLQGLHLDIPQPEAAAQRAGSGTAADIGFAAPAPAGSTMGLESQIGYGAVLAGSAAGGNTATPMSIRVAQSHYHQHQPAALTATGGGGSSGSPPLRPWPQHQLQHGSVGGGGEGGSPLRSPGGGWRRRPGSGPAGHVVGLSEEQLTGLLMWTVSDFFSSPSNSSSSGGSAGDY